MLTVFSFIFIVVIVQFVLVALRARDQFQRVRSLIRVDSIESGGSLRTEVFRHGSPPVWGGHDTALRNILGGALRWDEEMKQGEQMARAALMQGRAREEALRDAELFVQDAIRRRFEASGSQAAINVRVHATFAGNSDAAPINWNIQTEQSTGNLGPLAVPRSVMPPPLPVPAHAGAPVLPPSLPPEAMPSAPPPE